MNEFELIARLTRNLPVDRSVAVGAGDDCAVLDLGIPGRQLLFKTDAVVEGVHFTPETEPERIGRKALARCLSDMAAMGGTPGHAVVTIGLPHGFDPARVESVYAGLNDLARRHGVSIVGGETTACPGRMFLSIAMIGTVAAGRAVLRSGAKVGDAIFVSGELGGSIEGRHLDFEPRLEEARWLAEHCDVHAMTDLSDGLAGDLGRVLEASGVGAELNEGSIPTSRAARLRAKSGALAKPATLAALTDGEDFELLFTTAARDAVATLDGWKARFPEVPLTCVGRIVPDAGLRLRSPRGTQEIPTHGHVHFA